MDNLFDQFDKPTANPFDKFDAPKTANPFDQFDTSPAASVSATPQSSAAASELAPLDSEKFLRSADPTMGGLAPGIAVTEEGMLDNPSVNWDDPAQLKAAMEAGIVHDLPRPKGDSTGAGVVRGLEAAGEGLTTRTNIALMLSIGGLPGALQKVASLGFGAMMMKNIPEKITEAIDAKTPADRAEAVTGAALDTLMAAAAFGHAGGRIEGSAAVEKAKQVLRSNGLSQPEIDDAFKKIQEGKPGPLSNASDQAIDAAVKDPKMREGLPYPVEVLEAEVAKRAAVKAQAVAPQTADALKESIFLRGQEITAEAASKPTETPAAEPPSETPQAPTDEKASPAKVGGRSKLFQQASDEASKPVIDEVVYHSTAHPGNLSAEGVTRTAASPDTVGIFTSPDKEAATGWGGPKATVRQMRVKLFKPFDVRDIPLDQQMNKEQLAAALKAKGLDVSATDIPGEDRTMSFDEWKPEIESLTAKMRDQGFDGYVTKTEADGKEFTEHVPFDAKSLTVEPAAQPEIAAKKAPAEEPAAPNQAKRYADMTKEEKLDALSKQLEEAPARDKKRIKDAIKTLKAEPSPEIEQSAAGEPAAEPVKELWQKTKAEAQDQLPKHAAEVKAAAVAGKPVPLEVLEDFSGRKWADDARKKLYGDAISDAALKRIAGEAEDEWTSATKEEGSPKGMKRGGGEAGALSLPKFANRKMSELDRATTERSAKLQKSFDEAQRAQKEINKAIPDQKRQAAVSVWLEADGDASKLAQWEAGAKGEVFKRAAKDAQTLTPEEIAIANKSKKAFETLRQRGEKYEVLKSGRDNYVPHIWDVKAPDGQSVFGGSRLKQNFKFNKARTFENFAEGDAAGFKPKTLAIGKLLPSYLHEMNRVIADRQFVQDLAKGTAEDGRPLVVPRGNVRPVVSPDGDYAYLVNPRAIKGLKDAAGDPVDTTDYRTMENQPALHDWRWEGKDLDGNPIMVKDDLALHPDTALRVNAMLGKSAIREWYNEPGKGIAVVPKAIAKGLDRAQSVMKREMFGLLAPFHQVQEGTHSIAHRVNPFFDVPKIDLRKADQMDAARHGLMLLPDRAGAEGMLEGVGGKGTFLTQAARLFGESKAGDNSAGKAATALANVVDGYQDYLFHQYIPGLKFKTYQTALARNMELYAKELKSSEVSESDVKLMTAEQINAAYGHLNRDLLDRNPTIQHMLQLTLLAPDFLEARARFVGQAVKGATGSKVGIEQFKAIAFLAAVQAGIAYTTTKLLGDEYDPKNPFDVRHNGRQYSMRSVPADLLKFVEDVTNLAKGGDRGVPFISGRVNPLLESVEQLRTGINYRGERAGSLQTLEELFAKYIPITARALPGVRSLTETSRQNPVSPLEQLAGSLGVKISRASPITDTYALASQWMEKNNIAREKGSYPVSKFQQLRYALEDGDMDKAANEVAKLKKTTDPKAIAKGFRESILHPFTKNHETDKQFRDSLNPKDRAVYDLAVKKRVDILNRLNKLPNSTLPYVRESSETSGKGFTIRKARAKKEF
jgi:hypothetical protein